MFGGVTVEQLGQEASDVLRLLCELREGHDEPQRTQSAYLLHQARQNLRRFKASLESYQLACTSEPGTKVLVQKEFSDAEPIDTFGGARVRIDAEEPSSGNRAERRRHIAKMSRGYREGDAGGAGRR